MSWSRLKDILIPDTCSKLSAFCCYADIAPSCVHELMLWSIKIRKRISMPKQKLGGVQPMRGKRRRRRRRKAGRSSSKKREIEGGSQLLWQLHTSQHYSPGRCAFSSYPPHVLDPSHRLARCSSYRRRASKRHTFVFYVPSGQRMRIQRKSLSRKRKFRLGRDRADYSRMFTFHLQATWSRNRCTWHEVQAHDWRTIE